MPTLSGQEGILVLSSAQRLDRHAKIPATTCCTSTRIQFTAARNYVWQAKMVEALSKSESVRMPLMKRGYATKVSVG